MRLGVLFIFTLQDNGWLEYHCSVLTNQTNKSGEKVYGGNMKIVISENCFLLLERIVRDYQVLMNETRNRLKSFT